MIAKSTFTVQSSGNIYFKGEKVDKETPKKLKELLSKGLVIDEISIDFDQETKPVEVFHSTNKKKKSNKKGKG